MSSVESSKQQELSQLDSEKRSLESSLQDAEDAIKQANTGDTWTRYKDAERAVDDHIASRSLHLSPHGQLLRLDQLGESRRFNDNCNRLSSYVDMKSEVDNRTRSAQWVQDHPALVSKLRRILQQSDPMSPDYLRISKVELTASHRVLTSNNGEDEHDRLKDLVFDTLVSGTFASRDFQYQLKFPIDNHHALVHDFFTALMIETSRRPEPEPALASYIVITRD